MKCAQHYGERSYEGHVVSFFFNARGVELQKSTQGMYRSLIHQLLKKKKEQLLALPKHKGHSRHFQLLENLIEKSPQNKSHLAVELLKDMLRDLVLAFSPAQMVPSADALDDTETAERYGKSVLALALAQTQITCYVDALDECKEDDARDMLDYLGALRVTAVQTDVDFRVLLTSRHYPHIHVQSVPGTHFRQPSGTRGGHCRVHSRQTPNRA
jgi:hypothetical protein